MNFTDSDLLIKHRDTLLIIKSGRTAGIIGTAPERPILPPMQMQMPFTAARAEILVLVLPLVKSPGLLALLHGAGRIAWLILIRLPIFIGRRSITV